jgi:hypothetical protein
MAFKIPNFSRQMGGSPFRNTEFDPSSSYADKKMGYPYYNALADKMNELRSKGLNSFEIQKHPEVIAIKDNKSNIIMSAYNTRQENNPASNAGEAAGEAALSAEPQATNWDPALNELVTQRSTLEPGSNEYNIVQNKINEISGVSKRHPVVDTVEEVVVNPDNVEALDVAVDVNQHVPAEGINIISGKNNRKQRRAARRVARLRKKAQNQGGLTESQSKKLNRNVSKAKGEDVAFADRSKLGQIANITGDALGLGNKEEIV